MKDICFYPGSKFLLTYPRAGDEVFTLAFLHLGWYEVIKTLHCQLKCGLPHQEEDKGKSVCVEGRVDAGLPTSELCMEEDYAHTHIHTQTSHRCTISLNTY